MAATMEQKRHMESRITRRLQRCVQPVVQLRAPKSTVSKPKHILLPHDERTSDEGRKFRLHTAKARYSFDRIVFVQILLDSASLWTDSLDCGCGAWLYGHHKGIAQIAQIKKSSSLWKSLEHYRSRKMIRPRFKSYGERATFTLSPGTILI